MSVLKALLRDGAACAETALLSTATAWKRLLVQQMGKGCRIHPTAVLRSPDKINLGDHCDIRANVYMDGRSDRKTGIRLGSHVSIRSGSYLDCYCGGGFIHCGDYSALGQYVIIGGNGGVTIGHHTMIAGQTYIVSAQHRFDGLSEMPYRDQGETRRPVVIGNNVWIAAGCVVLQGVAIGDNSVIGAGSVVTRDIPAGVLAFGAPAQVRRVIAPKQDQGIPEGAPCATVIGNNPL